jgi:hypothetical protein
MKHLFTSAVCERVSSNVLRTSAATNLQQGVAERFDGGA